MAKYLLVTAVSPFPEDALLRLQEAFPDNHKVSENAWAIRSATTTTSKDIARIVFPPNEQGHGPRMLVVRFDAYGGYHQPSLWEWLSVPDE